MNAPMISARHVAKAYRVGGALRPPDSIREALSSMVRAPWRRAASGGGADNTFWALDDVSFDVQQGDVVGLLGRNGAGKSTILKVISRITEPTRGRIELRGRVASLLEVGTGFHAELTGRENIYMNGTILGMRRREIDRKFDQIVAFSEIERFIDTPVKRYSSGMYVRLAFAVAAHLDPEILVVDEVLAVGDAEFQRKCLGTMSDAAQSGRTVLFVSHNMAAMRALCTRAILLDRGRVILDGGVESAIKGYLEQTHSDAPKTEWKYLWKNPHARIVADDVEMIVNGEETRTVQAGDRCTFRVHYHTKSAEFVGTRYSPEIRLYADGQKLLSLAPHIRHGTGIPAEARGWVDCTIDRWPFRTRNMRLELVPWIGPDAQEHVLECMSFSSYDGDYYDSGVVPGQDDGFVFVDHTWAPAEARDARPRAGEAAQGGRR